MVGLSYVQEFLDQPSPHQRSRLSSEVRPEGLLDQATSLVRSIKYGVSVQIAARRTRWRPAAARPRCVDGSQPGGRHYQDRP